MRYLLRFSYILYFQCYIMALTLAAQGISSEFYRATSAQTNTFLVKLSSDGQLSWSTSALGSNYVVERTRSLSDLQWAPVSRGVVSNQLVLVKVMNPQVPRGFCLIPEGIFKMGDILNDQGDSNQVHPVFVSSFYIQTHEVTVSEFTAILQWAYDRQLVTVLTNHVQDTKGTNLLILGRSDSEISFVSGTFHFKAGREDFPANLMSWFGAVTYCNFLSQQQGYEPCYDLTNWTCDFSKLAYRLPTEAEWECAARGGYEGKRFPWPDTDTITHSRANYRSSTNNWYDVSPTRGLHPDYADTVPHSSPVGSFAPNNYGLYDMCGNVWEWVWDWTSSYKRDYQINPVGPASGTTKIFRGGSWSTTAERETCAVRYIGSGPTKMTFDVGFRTVLPCRPAAAAPLR